MFIFYMGKLFFFPVFSGFIYYLFIVFPFPIQVPDKSKSKFSSFSLFQRIRQEKTWDSSGSQTLVCTRTTWRIFKTLIAGLHSAVSDSVNLEWGPRFCIFNKFPGDEDDASQGIAQKISYLKEKSLFDHPWERCIIQRHDVGRLSDWRGRCWVGGGLKDVVGEGVSKIPGGPRWEVPYGSHVLTLRSHFWFSTIWHSL